MFLKITFSYRVGVCEPSSDATRGKGAFSLHSPRHRSLPVLSCPADIRRRHRSGSTKFEDEPPLRNSPATCPASPLPSVKFAVGEAVTTAAVGILGRLFGIYIYEFENIKIH